MSQFLLRVDDAGWRPEDKSNDVGLEYFQRWRDAFGIAGHPVVYGFIPSTVTPKEVDWLRDNLKTGEEIAVHGWDHARDAIVTTEQMQAARNLFSGLVCNSYIPPFNVYDMQTMVNWGEVCPHGDFFGGFKGEHHNFGELPEKHYGVVHLSAPRDLYDRAGPLTERLAYWRDLACPLVITLHATWDANNLSALRPLLKAIENDLVSPSAISQWFSRQQLDRGKLTAPHYLAYNWILEHVTPQDQVLDLGSRYSVLPAQMALRGARVTATDRDPQVREHQQRLFREVGAVPADILVHDGLTPWHRHDFHLVTSCWAIQHNLPEGAIPQVARNLGAALRPNGKLLIVSSFTPGVSFTQMTRADPQWVLSREDHQRLIMQPSGCVLEDVSFFRYEHASARGDFCAEQDANAICYVLRSAL